jgi:hypothetical protein
MRSASPQKSCRSLFMKPQNELPMPSSARQISRPSPDRASATRIDHGIGADCDPAPASADAGGRRMNAIRDPSGDHTGS